MLISNRVFFRRVKRQILSRLRLWSPAGANLTVRDGDAFLVSYPRSGNTWLRFLLAHLIHQAPLNFRELELVVADIYQNRDRELLSLRSPRILKSHELFDKRYRKVVYIVRDPRDVAISFYYWRVKKESFSQPEKKMSMQEYLEIFAEREYAFTLGNWAEHVESWLSQSNTFGSRLLVIKYEEMKKDAAHVLHSVAEHICFEHDETKVENAVRLSSLSNMRKAEKTLINARAKNTIPFGRKGKSGEWKKVFSSDLNNRYCEKFGKYMERFGYLPD